VLGLGSRVGIKWAGQGGVIEIDNAKDVAKANDRGVCRGVCG
jgi:hypothetical protein